MINRFSNFSRPTSFLLHQGVLKRSARIVRLKGGHRQAR
jgi:hypothetical protein